MNIDNNFSNPLYKRHTTSPLFWDCKLKRQKDIEFAENHTFILDEPLVVFRGDRHSFSGRDVEFVSRARAFKGDSKPHFEILTEKYDLSLICYMNTSGILRNEAYAGACDPFVSTALNPIETLDFGRNKLFESRGSSDKVYFIELPPGQEIIDLSYGPESVILVPDKISNNLIKKELDTYNFMAFLTRMKNEFNLPHINNFFGLTREFRDLVLKAVEELTSFSEETIQRFIENQSELIDKLKAKLSKTNEKNNRIEVPDIPEKVRLMFLNFINIWNNEV